MTDEGITALARVISMRGLPKVAGFMLGPRGKCDGLWVWCAYFAFINNGPELLVENIIIDWSGQPEHADFRKAMFDGMLRAAGRAAKVYIYKGETATTSHCIACTDKKYMSEQ